MSFGIYIVGFLILIGGRHFGSWQSKEKYENAQAVLVFAGGGGRWDSGRVLNDVHESSRRC
jgi:hypothetical protein